MHLSEVQRCLCTTVANLHDALLCYHGTAVTIGHRLPVLTMKLTVKAQAHLFIWQMELIIAPAPSHWNHMKETLVCSVVPLHTIPPALIEDQHYWRLVCRTA